MSVLSDFYINANRQLPLRWVSGNSYALDADVWSAVDGQLYRRIVAGAGATDPSSDATNWKRIAPSGVKAVQRGVNSLSAAVASVASIAITTVSSTAKCQLRIVSVVANTSAGPVDFSCQVDIAFLSVSALTISRLVTTNAITVAWELTEFY